MAYVMGFGLWMADLTRVMRGCGDPTDPHPDEALWLEFFKAGKTPEEAYYEVVEKQGYASSACTEAKRMFEGM